MTTEPITEGSSLELALKVLHESPLNPRKHFNPQAMAELTESVKARGVLTPLLVRPVRVKPSDGVTYEILAGARRYRAAKAAGLLGVPVVVRHLDDAAALEVMLIENLQRADVHPLEEASGFQQMMNIGRYTPTQLAIKVGKDESYVRRRVHLLKLFDGFKVLFEKGDIQLVHAQELARLTEAEQRRALKAFRGHGWDHWETPIDLRQWVDNHVHMQLKKAAFPKNDADLVPAAGSCTDCPKRTGASPMLFPDIKSPDICTDPACFNGKLDAFVKAETIRLREKGEPFVLMTSVESYQHRTPPKGEKDVIKSESINRRYDDLPCKDQEIALIVTGPDRGHRQRICRKKGCKVHTYATYGSSGVSPAERKRRATQKAKEKLEASTAEAVRAAIVAAAIKDESPVFTPLLEAIVEREAEYAMVDEKIVFARHGLKRAPKPGQLDQFALRALLLDLVLPEWDGLPERMARHYELNLAAIRKAALEEGGSNGKAAGKAGKEKAPKAKAARA